MLATYPIEATEENWLSACLTEAILTRLAQLDAGEESAVFPSDVEEDYREIIGRFTGIVDRFNALTDALENLNADERSAVRNAIETQNRIPDIFDAESECFVCNDTLPEVHALARRLFEFSFGALSRIKSPGAESSVRDLHYAIAYDHLSKKCCPFCGMERLEPHHPDIPRPDLDHYLAISRYPFCGVNLRNLTPMGDRCNSSYKLAEDILHDEHGNRLPCYDPYGDVTTEISLAGSVIVGSPAGVPVWSLQLEPATPQTENWNRVFRIELRLEQSLKAEFSGWVTEIGGVLRGLGYDLDAPEQVAEGLNRYRVICGTETLPGIGHLKAEVVSLLIEALGTDELQERTHTFIKEAAM